MSFSFAERESNIAKMANQDFDVLIIGGGITGAGAARDAASRGLSVALIEADDFASGTSSRSSKLIHGGIRYLENLEFHLVFEALSERKLLFEMAPHLVHPLRFVLPVFEGGRVGMFKLGLGMWAYDALALFDAPEMHERLSRRETMEHLPYLKAQGLCGSYVYSDAYMDDDRLVIETLRAAHRLGACAANYVKATGVQTIEGKVVAVEAQDQFTGKKFTIRGRHTVSTVGPWTDQMAQEFFPGWKKILRPSKGVHLTLDKSKLPLEDAVVMADDAKNRIVFGIPRYDMVIVGTTDTDYKGSPEEVHTERSDADYVLQVVNEYFPGAKVREQDVLASYAGVRPLVHDGSATEGKTSREHLIKTEHGVTFVAGGKYTTYRLMAEQTIDEVIRQFPLGDRVRFGKSNTKVPLNPLATTDQIMNAHAHVEYWKNHMTLSTDDMTYLAAHHGMEAESLFYCLAHFYSGTPQQDRLWILEAWHAIQETMCLSLRDFYLRRTHLFLARKDHGVPLLPALGKVFAEMLGWNDAETKKQIQEVHNHIQFELGWQKAR